MTGTRSRTIPRYTPLSKVEDRMVREAGIRRFADDPSDVAWLDPARDESSKSLASEAEN